MHERQVGLKDTHQFTCTFEKKKLFCQKDHCQSRAGRDLILKSVGICLVLSLSNLDMFDFGQVSPRPNLTYLE